jgi:hypothetical protein
MGKEICSKCGTEIKRSHCTEDYLVFECQSPVFCHSALLDFEDNTDEDWEWVIKYYRKELDED